MAGEWAVAEERPLSEWDVVSTGPAAAPQPGVPRAIGAVALPPPRPPQRTLAERIRGVMEAGVELASQITGGAVGVTGGAIGGLAGALASSEIGTSQGARRVAETATASGERGAGAVRGALRGLLWGDAPVSEAGQENIDAVTGVMQNVPAAIAAPRGTIGMSPQQPLGIKPALQAVADRTAVPAAGDMVTTNASALNRQKVADTRRALEQPELEGVRKAHDAGFWLTPEAAKAGAAARGVAIAAGRKSVARHMARHNEENTARLVRQDVGLPEDVPITREALATVRKEAGEAYGVLERYGEFETDPQLHSDISGITAQARKIAEEFPTLLDSPLLDHAAAVDVPKMTTTGAIAVVRDLRNKADKAMRGEKPDRVLASAYRGLANAVDSSMERALAKRVANESPEAQAAFDAYRAARTRIAKAHLAEDALTGVPGEVDSAAYAKADEKLGGKMTGPGKEIADFHKQFAKQGLAKAPKAPPGEWFHEWRIGALLHAPFTIGGAIATRLGAQHGLGTNLAQQAITRRARAAAPVPDASLPDAPPKPGLELAPEGPLPPRPAGEAPPAPLGDLTPDWETAPGAAPVGPRAEVVPAEGLVQAVDSPQGPARVQPGGYDPRPGRNFSDAGPVRPGPAAPAPDLPRGVRPVAEEIPAVPGRPDLPDAMVAGPPAELAPTEAVGAAMQEPTTVLARRQQEAARLAAETQSPEVQRVLAEHAKKLERQAAAEAAKQKRLQDAAELRRVAAQTADPEIQQALHARATTLEAAEPVPVGKTKELDAAPAAKPAKEPAKPLPAGEATEIAAEVVEPVAAAPAAPAPRPAIEASRTEPRVGKAGPKDKFVVGRVYRDSQGNMAIRQADGSWKEIK